MCVVLSPCKSYIRRRANVYWVELTIKWLQTGPTLYEIFIPRHDSGPTFKNKYMIFFFFDLPDKNRKV